jgi:transcription elongation GreA/GreB family factor
MPEKTNILDAYIKKQEERIKNLEESFKLTKRKEIEAPTGMQSWSDTTRFQEGELASKIQKQIIMAKQALDKLKSIDRNSNSYISVGSLFTLRDVKNKKVSNYFLIYEECSGDILNIKGEKVMIISVTAPLIKVLANKKAGDVVNYGDKFFEVVDVQ